MILLWQPYLLFVREFVFRINLKAVWNFLIWFLRAQIVQKLWTIFKTEMQFEWRLGFEFVSSVVIRTVQGLWRYHSIKAYQFNNQKIIIVFWMMKSFHWFQFRDKNGQNRLGYEHFPDFLVHHNALFCTDVSQFPIPNVIGNF